MEELPEIERSIEVDGTPNEVWRQVVESELAEEWLGVEIDPCPGGSVTVPGQDVMGTFEEIDPARSITWSWRMPDGDPSQVRIQIEPTQTGSRVTVTERLLEYRITGTPPGFFEMAA